MTTDAGDPPGVLAVALILETGRLDRRLAAQGADMPASQLAVLADLEESPATPAALAAREEMRPPSMTRHIAALEARGLISREPHPSDQRQVTLSLTDQGREALAAAREAAWLTARVRALSRREQGTLLSALRVLAKIRTVCDPEDPG